jgi:hypothetical protein
MKNLAESKALERLQTIKSGFAGRIKTDYEHRAKDCLVCETPGACCLDAHFVNVHITRLEAVAIRKVIDRFPDEKRAEILARVEEAISKYHLSSDGDTFTKTYACPLFEKGIGCLVHHEGKPVPCIAHACYEYKEDLPADELVAEQEGLIGKLNEITYKKPATWLPLPLAIRN